jgi:predicted DNA-binding transcriptional regulator AlpA
MAFEDRYLSGPHVDERYDISPMTRWRWQRDPNLDFPKPIETNGRKRWRLRDLENWERSRAASKQERNSK